MRARYLRLASLAAITLLLAVAVRTLDISRLGAVMIGVSAPWLLAACCAYVGILPLWALQWKILAPQVPRNTWRRMLGVVAMTSAALNATPLLVGEVAGMLLLATEVGLTGAQALSVTAMDQLMVGVAKVCVIASAALTNPIPSWLARGLIGLATGVGVIGALIIAGAWRSNPSRLPLLNRLPAALGRQLDAFAVALHPIRVPSRAFAVLFLALTKKVVELLAILAVQRAFGVHLTPSSALLVLASLNIATLVPVVPGNLGVYEGVVTLAYVTLGVEAERAAAIAIVQHACFWFSLAIPGYLWAAISSFPRRTAAAR